MSKTKRHEYTESLEQRKSRIEFKKRKQKQREIVFQFS